MIQQFHPWVFAQRIPGQHITEIIGHQYFCSTISSSQVV